MRKLSKQDAMALRLVIGYIKTFKKYKKDYREVAKLELGKAEGVAQLSSSTAFVNANTKSMALWDRVFNLIFSVDNVVKGWKFARLDDVQFHIELKGAIND